MNTRTGFPNPSQQMQVWPPVYTHEWTVAAALEVAGGTAGSGRGQPLPRALGRGMRTTALSLCLYVLHHLTRCTMRAVGGGVALATGSHKYSSVGIIGKG